VAFYFDSVALDSTNSIGAFGAPPLNEQSFFESGTFYASDCYGDMGVYNIQNTTSAGTGLPKTSVGDPTTPGAFTYADLAAHPGIMWVQASTAGTGGSISASLNSSTVMSFAVSPTSAPTIFRMIFNGGKNLSTASDRFITAVGFFAPVIAGTTGAHPNGWYIEYSDDVNGGNWVFKEASNGAVVTTVTTNIPFVANQWSRLTLVASGNTVSATITPCGTSNNAVIFTGNSPTLQAGNSVITTLAAQAIWLTTKTAPTAVGSLIDYFSLTVSNPGRVW
jgi:hypothetical protein